jgi:uncharacterized surface protein with fasciclin (FAS1) repeats
MIQKHTVLSAIALTMACGAAVAQCGSTTTTSTASACSSSNDKQATTRVAYNLGAPDIVDTAVAAGDFMTLVAAVKAAGLVDVLKGDGPFTVFAPTDEAFARLADGKIDSLLKAENRGLLTTILTYHVVPGRVLAKDVVGLKNAETVSGQRVDIRVNGGTVFIDNAKVTATDIETSNGVIHVIDTVIMPETKTIPGVADEAGSFGTLLKAVNAAGLAETLMGEGPFTVFAPTDEAFAKLGSTVTDLLKPENRGKLTSILTYHVVPGRVFSGKALELGSAKTVQGGEITIKADSRGAKVNNANLIKTDIDASNGVIHVIDTVLIPG